MLRNKFLKAFMILGLLVMQFQSINATDKHVAEAASLIVSPGNMNGDSDGYGYVKLGTTINPFNGEKVFQLWHSSKGFSGTTFYVDAISGILYSTGDRNAYRLLGRKNDAVAREARVFQPAEFNGALEGEILDVHMNEYSTILLTSTGELWYTGDAGNDNTIASLPTVDTFHKINPATFDGKVVEIESFDGGTFVLTEYNTLYFSGNRGAELLGSSFGDKTQFAVAPNPEGKKVVEMWGDESGYTDGDERHIRVKTEDGSYYGVGEGVLSAASGLNRISNSYGWLPVLETRNGTIQRVEPNSIVDFKTYDSYVTFAVRNDGTVWVTGNDDAAFDMVSGSMGTGHYNTRVFEIYPDYGNDNTKLFEGGVTGFVAKEKTNENGETELNLWVSGENYRDLGTVFPVDSYQDSGCPVGGPAVCPLAKPVALVSDDNYFNSTNWNKTEPFMPQYIIGGFDNSLAVDQDGFLRSAGYTLMANSMAYETQAIFPPVTPDSTLRTEEYYPNNADNNLFNNITNPQVSGNARVEGEYKLYETIYVAKPTASFDGFGQAFEESQENTLDPNTITMGPVRGNDYAFDADGTKQFDMFMQYNVYKYNSTTGEFLNEVPGYSGVQNINDNLATLDLSKLTTGDYVVRMSRYTVNDDGEKYVSLTIDEPFRIVNAPVLTVPEFTEVPHNANFEVMDGVSVTDTEDNDAELYNKIIATPSEIDTSVPGTYKVDYTVTDSHNNTVSKSQVVVVNDGTIEIGEKYILQALDYSIHRKNVDVNNVLVDASVKLNEKETGDSLPVTTDTISVTYGTPDYNNASTQEEASKDYPITFGVIDEPTLTNDIIATVSNAGPEILGADYTEIDEGKTFNALAGVSATDKEDGDLTSELVVTGTVDTNTPDLYVLTYTVTDSDDNTSTVKRVVVVKGEGVTVGNDYVIKAQNFTQGVGEVDSANVANFASVKIYDKDGNELSVSDTVNVTYGSPSYANAASTTVDTTAVYPITFTHKTDSTTTITVNGSVTNYAPVISGEKTVVVEKDAIVDTTEGLTVTDVEDDDSTIEVFGGTLYTDTEGVFKVDITATDSDGNTTTFTRVYLVDGEIIDYFENYAIMAEDFVKTVSTAKTETVIDDANVKVYELFTGNLIDADSNVIVTYGTPDYRNASTQTKFVESYPINFKVANEPETTIDVTAKVIIDDAVIGEDYALIASDFTIDLSETPEYMDTDTSDIITSSNARAEHLEDGSAGTPAVVSNGIQPKVGSYKVVINVEEEPALQKEIIVTVKDSNTVIGENYGLKAENFKITVDQAADYMDADIADVIGENGAKVVAWELATNNSAEVALASNGIKATEGVYPVEIYVVNEPTTKKTVYVTVTGDNGALTGDEDILLVAHNFTVDLTNNETLPSTIAEFIELAKVEAINTADGSKISDLSNLSVDPATMAGYTDGLYEVVFTLADESGDAVVTVNALVIDDNTGTGIIDGVNYAVTADDFVIDKRSGSGYQETDFDSSAKIVAAANAKAINADTMEVDTTKTLESNKSSFVGVVAGVYETTYTISNTTISGVANVLVMDDGSTVGNDGVVINGYNFTINSEEAKVFTSNDVITNGNVSAFNKDTLEVLDVVVNATDLAAINTGVSGVYPVELGVSGSETTKTIFVTVIGDNGVLTGDGEFLLNAYDFTVDLTKGETLPTNINEFVTVANAKITNTQTGEVVTDYSNLSTAPATMAGYTDGLYEVVFTLADESGDAVLTVNALVIDENTGTGIIDGVNYAVTADDFVIDKRSGSDYTSTDFDSSAKIVAAANAVAINADTMELDTEKVIVSNPNSFVDSAAGVYETTYTIENTTISGVANVLVMDDESTVGNDGVVINGSNFTITSEVAKTLTSNDVITTGNVSAFNKDTLEVYNVVVNASNLAEINKGISGVYPVTLNVNGSFTAKTIYVTVTDDNGTLTGDGEFLLNAYDFTVDLTKGETLPTNINEFVELANAKITNTQTGEEVTDYSNLSTAPATMAGYTDGLYEVVFTLADESGDAVLTVNALVIDDNTGTGIIDGVNYAVTANDFVIDKRSESSYVDTDFDSSAKIVAAANAVAINADSREVDTTKTVVSNPSTFVDNVAGIYETTYTIENSAVSGVANVLIIDDNSVVGTDGVVINGSNFAITDIEAKALTASDVVTISNASAFNKDTFEVLDVVVNATDLAEINKGVGGVYPVELGVSGSETTKTIFVTVTDRNSIITEDGEYLLQAYDFVVDLSKGEKLPATIEEFVQLANAKITNTQTGEAVTDYSMLTTDPSTLEGHSAGIALVKFTYNTNPDVETTVGLMVVARIIGTPLQVEESQYALAGHSASVHENDLNNANLAEEFELALEVIVEGDIRADYDLADAVFTTNGNPVKDLEPGIYLVDIVLDDLYLQLPLVVTNDYTVIDNNKVLFVDNTNLKYTDEEATGLTFEDIVNDSNARAFVIETQEQLPLTTLTPEVVNTISQGTPGEYEVSIKANPEAFVNIEVVETQGLPETGGLTETGGVDYLVWFLLILLVLVTTRQVSKKLRK